jgi:pyruvate carboxylase
VGLPTNIKFLKRVLLNREFETGEFDTSFIAKHEEELLGQLKTQQGDDWKVRA